MITPACSACLKPIPADDINVAKDVAYCRPCNIAHTLSALVADADEFGPPVDPDQPPAGTWLRRDALNGLLIGATHRSWGAAAGTLAVALFWNGIVSIFVLIALSGSLHHLGIAVPAWFPAPKMDGQIMGLGELIFLWLFLTPFIVIGTGMVLAFLSSLFGRTEVRIQGTAARAFVGIGPLGWSRRFPAAAVQSVSLVHKPTQNDSEATQIHVELTDGKTVKFGSLLNPNRRRFLASALRAALR